MSYSINKTKNLEHIYSVLCSSSVVDNQSNNISLHSLTEKLTINVSKELEQRRKKEKTDGFAININLQIVTRLMRLVQKKDIVFDYRVEYENPEGKVMIHADVPGIVLKKESENFRMRQAFDKLVFDSSGLYHFSVKVREVDDGDFTEVAKIPLEVVLKYE